ncbi:hypothetical protein DFO53_1874 [Enterobacter sp. AG5470]|nr:hypothetical protein DFO53_1874 [Enterobacter sp. AG5470]
MFIIFGWLKESCRTPYFINNYCYNCGCEKSWGLYSETEWVTFFDIKTIPFLIKRKVFCERCGDEINVSYVNFFLMHKNKEKLGSWMEDLQLASKTENQRKYLIERRKNSINE